MAVDNTYLSAVVYSHGETGKVFPISWDRLDNSHVQVYFDGGLLVQNIDYSYDNTGINLITYTLGVTNELIITRFTPRENRRIDWSTGAPFVTAALDAEGINNHYIRQELFDWIRLFDTTVVGATGPQGPRGPQGPTGSEGPQGIEGPRGIQGVQGIDGPQGVLGPEGPIGPIGQQGIQGVEGPQGQTGPQGIDGPEGPTGPHGIQGAQGPLGPSGADGTSFRIDALGTLLERNNYDNELKDFSYYATDYSVQSDSLARFMRATGDGTTTDFVLSFSPDGQQSLNISIGGVVQTPDNYTITINLGVYTIQFNTAPVTGIDIVVREFTISTGYGAIFLKASDIAGHWSDAIPFGKGPRGDQGIQGIDGIQGPVGDVGPRGQTGPQGAQGIDGQQGIQGPTGTKGEIGDQGSAGIDGQQGPQGVPGVEGPVGPQGAPGPRGDQGFIGEDGIPGANGLDGVQGPKGDKGDKGDKGLTGDKGPNGDDGADGADGSRGADGTDGADGRSSSGKKYTTTSNKISYGNPVEFDRGTVAVSKPFVRNLRASSVFVQLNSDGQGATEHGWLIIEFGGNTYYGPELSFASTNWTTLPSPIVPVPANTTGTFIVKLASRSNSTVWAGPQDWIMEILPESTELG